ncbi:MAG: acetyl-CoA carboxylase biotin carboxyl carrier protein, partial [Geminicoccaceae bacterium]|nr:acetyl-CoA carboxylase biotin carboxyl carrier protein [Geminicoccaceae bacterium]
MAKLNIDTDYVAKLAELLQRTGLTEIEISEGDVKVRVAKKISQRVEVQAPPATGGQAPAAPAAAAGNPPEPAPASEHPGTIKSPMVGTVYTAPEPGSPPFVTAGEEVKEGQTLLII